MNPEVTSAQGTSGATTKSTNVDTSELPVHLTPCLEDWLSNQDHYVNLSDMHSHGGCHVLQLIDMTLKDGVPTGEVMLHDGVHFITAKVTFVFLFLFYVKVYCVHMHFWQCKREFDYIGKNQILVVVVLNTG